MQMRQDRLRLIAPHAPANSIRVPLQRPIHRIGLHPIHLMHRDGDRPLEQRIRRTERRQLSAK
jgi:hypothetical protein